ncbi:conjugative transfer signal peptidase TraF [Phenylobacterium haematophilum]|jgi:conjugative transfer signal peptidase TraF|uniref:Conjugative transfer signal peptidase TraF n=1 Tax=Phenylobacterium haematophilum TaxID=98513 RepID=A0A840A2I6_9CAUL|nr:S26 family signal peptidase [Phenylobacterium haematophilum]MBB3892836.1 conjugative transfer signal peptidase TraF [Phenylobacterium haematophilum]
MPLVLSRPLSPVFALGALGATALLGAASLGGPWVLWNRTDSEPLGIYTRTLTRPAIGRLIAFQAPAAAFPYADGRMAYLRRVPILKQIAAVEGDLVCARDGVLAINGRPVAPVYARDPRGRALPQWNGCRRLQAAEYFVYSDRIPNSFDSRYYGPIRGERVLGVYRPLAAAQTASGAR